MNNKGKFILYENDDQFSYVKNNKNIQVRFNRVAFIFFVFFIVSIIYLIHLIHLGSRSSNDINDNNSKIYNKLKRADIVDRNGNFLAKTVSSIDIGINPIEIIDQKKLFFSLPQKKPIIPSSQEIKENQPSRSAKLRYIIKNDNSYEIDTDLVEKFSNLLEIENLGSKL